MAEEGLYSATDTKSTMAVHQLPSHLRLYFFLAASCMTVAATQAGGDQSGIMFGVSQPLHQKTYSAFGNRSKSHHGYSAFVSPLLNAPPSLENSMPSSRTSCLQKLKYVTSTFSNTKLLMSSRPPPSPRPRGQSGPQKTRVRGANAANQNRRGHSFRINSDGSAKQSSRKKNTKRSPRWEREGDKLYAEVSKQLNVEIEDGSAEEGASKALQLLANQNIATVHDVCDVLKQWMITDEEMDALEKKREEQNERNTLADSSTSDSEESKEPKKEAKSPPFLWGPLPVGPVLASRLRDSQRPTPTSVQRAAFTILTAGNAKGNNNNNPASKNQRTNAIIASPTGTGKTLAYLLPFLCTSPGGQQGEGTGGVLIVTPTIELACQIQREVDVLWPPVTVQTKNEKNEVEESERSSMFVVGAIDSDDSSQQQEEEDNDDNYGEEQGEFDEMSQGRKILRSIEHAPLIAGTPKMLRMLYREAEYIAEQHDLDPEFSAEERATAKALISNLRAVVLDEADRLLRTEAVARETTELKQRKLAQRKFEEAEAAGMDTKSFPAPIKKKTMKKMLTRPTQTEFLLRDLPVPSLDDIQFVCASATIGRTLRRQMMQLLGATSADAAATLVTGDDDARVKSKDAEKRKSVLLPEKLRHAYRVVGMPKDAPIEELFDELVNMSVAERNEERKVEATINALWDTMTSMEVAKPIIIFPGRVGVDRVQKELMARGLEDVRTLRNLDGTTPEADVPISPDVKVSHIDNSLMWKSVPVYIIGERFARGLDIADVEYVIMLSPPSSAAGYAHMSGRTGRSGRDGTAITLVRPKNNEVQRMVAIAEALGLKFASSLSGVAGGVDSQIMNDSIELVQTLSTEENQQIDAESLQTDDSAATPEVTLYPWKNFTESALKRKKKSELVGYLQKFGDFDGQKIMTKPELASEIMSLHSKK